MRNTGKNYEEKCGKLWEKLSKLGKLICKMLREKWLLGENKEENNEENIKIKWGPGQKMRKVWKNEEK